MMYQIKRNGRTLKSLGVHLSYEKARQAARKYIRSKFTADEYEQLCGDFGIWDKISRNPTTLSAVGIRIVKT